MTDLSSFNLTGTNNPAYNVSVTKWNQLLAAIGAGDLSEEQVRDLVGSLLVAGTGVTITPNDAGDTITISATGGGGVTDPEVVRDTIAASLVAGANVTITPNDAGDTITISATGGGTTDPEVVRDTIAAALVAGTNITIVPNDAGDQIVINSTASGGSTDPEVVRDTMAGALVAGANVTITVDDTANTITIASSGAGGGSVTGLATVLNRATMAGIAAPADGDTRFLIEGKRAGLFKFSTANLSGQVTADPQQGIYVAPTSATTGASGAWVRQYDGVLRPEFFGAVGTSPGPGLGTDDYVALNACIKFCGHTLGGGKIQLDRAIYRSSQQLKCTEFVSIEGMGHNQNPGLVAGQNIQQYEGSIICFDANVPGMILYSQNDMPTAAAYDAGTSAEKFEFKSAQRSVLRDFMLWGGGENGTSSTAHGLECRCVMRVENVRISHFSGSGMVVTGAGHTETTAPYGIADHGLYRGVVIRINGMHGLYVIGNDANVNLFDGLDIGVCGGAGVLDRSQLGNTYVCCHVASSNGSHASTEDPTFTKGTPKRTVIEQQEPLLAQMTMGAYMTWSPVGAHTFIGCYSEGTRLAPGGQCHILSPSMVMGGNIASDLGPNGVFSDDSTGFLVGFGKLFNLSSVTSGGAGTAPLTVYSGRFEHQTVNDSAIFRVNGFNRDNNYFQIYCSNAKAFEVWARPDAAYIQGDNGFTFQNLLGSTVFGTLNATGMDVPAGKQFSVGGTKVVGARQAAIANHASDATVNAILTALRAHGLIAP